jgi:hypothetical protein
VLGNYLWRHTNGGVKLLRSIWDAVLHHQSCLSDVANVCHRIAIHQSDVSEFPRGNRTEITVQPHNASGVKRGILQNFVCGYAGLDIELEFAMQGESSQGVRAVFN